MTTIKLPRRKLVFSVDPLLPGSRHQSLKALLQLTGEIRPIQAIHTTERRTQRALKLWIRSGRVA